MKKKMGPALIFVVLIILAAPFGFFYVVNYGKPYANYIAHKNFPIKLKVAKTIVC